MHDTEHRAAVFDEADQHRELAVAGDEFPGAIERIDQPETRRRRAGKPRLRHGLLGHHRNVGKGLAEHFDNDSFRGEIGLGDRRQIAFLGDLACWIGISAHHRFAAGLGGAQGNLEQGIHFQDQAAFCPAASRKARHSHSGVNGMSR